MDTLSTVLILSAVLQVIILICFFTLCSNVNKIRKRFEPASSLETFSFILAMEDKEAAKQILIRIILEDTNVINAIHQDQASLNASLGKYRKAMNQLNIQIDTTLAVETLKYISK